MSTVLLRLSLAGLAVHVAHGAGLGLGPPGGVLGSPLMVVVVGLAAAAGVLSALRTNGNRLPHVLLCGGIVSYAAGQLVLVAFQSHAVHGLLTVPDVLWVVLYPCTAAALILSARGGLAGARPSLWLDGLIAGTTVLTVGSLLFVRILIGSGSQVTGSLLIYPMLDLIVLGLIVVALASSKREVGRGVVLLMAAFLVLLATDTVNVYRMSHGTYVPGGLSDSGWAAVPILIALALRQPLTLSVPGDELQGWRLFAIPALGLATGAAQLTYEILHPQDVLLAVATPAVLLGLVAIRLFASLSENARRSLELAASEKRFRRIIQTTHEGVWMIDNEYRTTFVNPRMAEMLGYGEHEMVGRPLWDFLDQEGSVDVARLMAEKRAGQHGTIEVRYKRKDGSDLWALLATSEVLDDDGIYRGALGMHTDITERMRVEQEVRESRSRLAAAQALAHVGSWEWEPATDRISWSDELARIYGFRPGNAPAAYAGYLERVHPDDREQVKRTASAGLELREPWHHEFRIVRTDGAERVIDSRAEILCDEEGRIVRMVGTAQDVTERKLAEQELRRRARQQAAIAGLGRMALGSPDPVRLMDAAVHTTAEILEVDEVRVLELRKHGQGLTLRASGGPSGAGRQGGARPADTESLIDDALDGVNVLIEDTGSPYGLLCARTTKERQFTKDDANFLEAVANVLGAAIARERTEQLEARVQQGQRLESVGQLAGGVAHDFNNLLSVILNYARFAMEELGDGNPLREDIGEIKRAAERAAELTQQLLLFSRRKVVQPEVQDVNAVVVENQNLIARAIGEHILIEANLDPRIPLVSLGEGQIEQVLINLAVNARDAMPAGGKLAITTEGVDLDGAATPGESSVPFGSYVRLTVADTGSGMDPDTVARAFEPFFTTKPTGSGTGLGLATVYGIVRQAGGYSEIHSEPGNGTVVEVYLPPASQSRSPRAPRQLQTEELRGSGEVILLVEDEPAVRALTERILCAHDYTVIAAAGGASALDVCRDRGCSVDLLLTDVVMPHLSGREVAEQIREVKPGIRTLYMSGYASGLVGDHGLVEPGAILLEKPFSAATLLQKVRFALDDGNREPSRSPAMAVAGGTERHGS